MKFLKEGHLNLKKIHGNLLSLISGGGMEFRNISKLAKLKHRQIILKPLIKSRIPQNGLLICSLNRIKKELKLLGLKNL